MVDQDMSEASPTAAGAFLERAEGLLALEGSLTEIVAGGGGSLLLVTGEAGVGKTATTPRSRCGHDHAVSATIATVALRSRRLGEAHDCSPSNAIVPSRLIVAARSRAATVAGVC